MKNLIISLISLTIASVSYGQLNVFNEGDVVSAEEMNENFEFLINGTQTRVTTVDCGINGSGSGINQAILEGFNDITIKGVCQENLNFGTATKDEPASSGNPAPKYLRLVGFDGNAVITDASNYEQSVIRVDAGTLVVENLIVEGGNYTISGNRNANVLLSGVTVQHFTERGVSINDSSYLGVDESGLTVTTNKVAASDVNQYGIRYVAGSSGWLHTVEVSNVDRGIAVYGGSMTYAYSFNIHDVGRAIAVSNSRFLKYGEGNSVVKSTSSRAITVYSGSFTHWEGNLEINNISDKAFDADRSTIEMLNAKMDGNQSTLEDVASIRNSKFRIVNLEISNSGDDGLRIEGSEGSIENLTINNSSDDGLRIEGSSGRIENLTINNSGDDGLRIEGSYVKLSGIITIDGNSDEGIELRDGSVMKGGWWDQEEERPDYTIQVLNSGDDGIKVQGNSLLDLENFLVEGSANDGVRILSGSRISGGWREEDNLPDHLISIRNSGGTGLDLEGGSHGDISSLLIEGSGWVGLDVEGNSAFSGGDKNDDYSHPEYTILIRNNSGPGIESRQFSRIYVENMSIESSSALGIRLQDHSVMEIKDSKVVSSSIHGVDVYDFSTIKVKNSQITANHTFNQDDGNQNGSNGITAFNNSQIEIDWGNDSTTTIQAGAFPLKARKNSKIDIGSKVQLTSALNWNKLQIERGSKLNLGGLSDMIVQNLDQIFLAPDTETNLSDRWLIENVNCHNESDINGEKIYRDAVIYRNGSSTDAENFNSNCILAN